MAYSKIRQPKLSDVIEQQLEFLILEGTLRPGEKLPPERELAKQFDVSRPSLREAIQRLEAKGLLLRRQGGGTFVQSSLWQSFSDPLVELLSDHPESQFDLLETRHALEGIAAYYAALRSTDEDKDRIRELHHAIELAQESGDLDAESEAVLQYQIAVTEAELHLVYGADAGAKRAAELRIAVCASGDAAAGEYVYGQNDVKIRLSDRSSRLANRRSNRSSVKKVLSALRYLLD